MWKLTRLIAVVVLAAGILSQANAQPPKGKGPSDPDKVAAKDYASSSIVTKMLAFNKKNDGKLTKDEVTDGRLHRLFEQADANKDGVVTKEELMALAAKLDAEFPAMERKGPPKGPKMP